MSAVLLRRAAEVARAVAVSTHEHPAPAQPDPPDYDGGVLVAQVLLWDPRVAWEVYRWLRREAGSWPAGGAVTRGQQHAVAVARALVGEQP